MFYNFFSYLNHKRDGPRVRLHVPYPMYVTLTFSLIASIAYIHTLIQGPSSRVCSHDIFKFRRKHRTSFSISGCSVIPMIK